MRQLITLTALLAICVAVPAQGAYKSEKHGFSLKVPSGFREIPIKAGEKWILAKWQAKRPYFYNSKEGFTFEHKPMLRVLSFPKGLKRVETDKRGDTTVTTIKDPYRNYRDYLKRHYQGGGWFISKENELKLKGAQATYMEVNIDKLSNTPKFYLACIYHQEDRDIAVEIDVLKKHYPKLRGNYTRALKSMKLFEAKVSAKDHNERADAPTATTGEIKDFRKYLRDRKAAWKKKALDEAAQNLPAGWKKINTKEFLILTHTSPKYTKRMIDFSKSIRKWLDKNFKDVGEGKLSKSIIRICADSDEANAYLSGSGDSWFSSDSGEVVCSGGGQITWDMSRVARGVATQYFSEKNPRLWDALPDWMNGGLGNYIGNAQLSSKGFRFAQDTDALLRIRNMITGKRLVPVKELLSTIAPQYGSDEAAWEKRRDYDAACAMFVRFLFEGPGKKGKSKKLLANYLKKAVEILDEMEEDEFKDLLVTRKAEKEALTEEEEEEQWKNRNKGGQDFWKKFAERKQKLLQAAHDHAFEGWSDRDWKKLDSSFRSWAAK